MKIKISKSQWESMGKKAGWKKTAQGRPNREKLDDADTLIHTDYISKMQKMLHAIDLAIPCLEDWAERTGFGETHRRDQSALNALKESIKGVEHLRGHGF